MTAHIHAELMKLYAEDAMETDKPWERWSVRLAPCRVWRPLRGHPSWDEDSQYRRKPRTIRIGEYDVPEPLRTAPERGTRYWVVSTNCLPIAAHAEVWVDFPAEREWLEHGLIHLNYEAAELHAKALLSFTLEQKA